MASSLNLGGLSKYTDQLSQALVRESVLAGETFKYITVMTDVKYSDAINTMTTALNMVAGGCGLISPTGSVVLAQNVLTVCPIKVEESICEQDLEQYWTGKFMQAGSYQEELSPKQFAQIYTADKQAKLAASMDDLFWKASASATFSSDANMLLCTGLLSILIETSASASVLTVTASMNVAMTSANAVATIDGMIAKMNTSASQILTENDLTIFMSYADFNALLVGLRAVNFFHNDIGQTGHSWSFIYPGTTIKIVAVRGLNGLAGGKYYRLLTNASNLVVGTDLMSDYSKFRIWFEDLYDLVYFRAKFKIGAGARYYQNIIIG